MVAMFDVIKILIKLNINSANLRLPFSLNVHYLNKKRGLNQENHLKEPIRCLDK